MKRRNFIKQSGQLAVGMSLFGATACVQSNKEQHSAVQEEAALFFKISLAEWSLHKALGFNETKTKTLDHLDFAATARKEFGIEAVEYVNGFFKDKAEDEAYLAEMKKRADDNGVKSLLIMVDGEGDLGSLKDDDRTQAVKNHFKWVDAAKFLGCHSIRVNAFGEGKKEDVAKAMVDSLSRLSEYAAKVDLNVIVENHGGYSSDGDWIMGVMREVNMANCGMLPDFGNFCMRRKGGGHWDGECIETFDRYKGVEMFMPIAKAVSAKTYDFDEAGNETTVDFMKMMKIVKDGGYTGYVGIEYEGSNLPEMEGIRQTKALLERVGAELSK